MQDHLNIYASRAFQWYKEHLIWTNFMPCAYIHELAPQGKMLPKAI